MRPPVTDSERLAQAEDAYHKLMIGASFVEARDANGEMVRYKPADAAKLKAYIAELKRSLGPGSYPKAIGVIG